jgi:hypothetical protein
MDERGVKILSMKLIVILSIKKDFKYRTNLMLKEQLKEIWDYYEG